MCIRDRTKDDAKARLDLESLCNRKELHLQRLHDGKVLKPKAKFSLNIEQSQPSMSYSCSPIKKRVRVKYQVINGLTKGLKMHM